MTISLVDLIENVILDVESTIRWFINEKMRIPRPPEIPGVTIIDTNAAEHAMNVTDSRLRQR